MKRIYRFKVLRMAALLLLCAPAFVACGVLLIRLRPQNPLIWIIGCLGILFFGACFIYGLGILRQLSRNCEALILTPEKITIRQPNGKQYDLKWSEIRGFNEIRLQSQSFIAVVTYEIPEEARQERNRFRMRLAKWNRSLTGSAINISPDLISCQRNELYKTLCRYLEKYGQ